MLTYLAALQNSAGQGVMVITSATRAASSYEGLTPPVLHQVLYAVHLVCTPV